MSGHGPHDMAVMHWRPKMVKLTQATNPDLSGGQPTPLYVEPQHIVSIRRTHASFATADSYGRPKDRAWDFHPTAECTEVHCGHLTLLVTESPDEVAKLRDEAFGFEDKPAPPNLRSLP